MSSRTLSLPVASQPSIDALVDLARLGEARGYDRVWVPETWGRDAVTVLATLAAETDAIGLGSSILPVYSRSPALLGQTAATLQETADGRFRLGLGPSGPAVIEHWHGEAFDRPLRYTRETLEVVRRVLSGEVVSYDGRWHELEGFRLRSGPPETPVPIDLAGMGPTAVELAGRYADGWHAITFTPEGMADRLQDLERGIDLAGRERTDVRVTLSVTACALADADRARRLGREHLAFYIGSMGSFYRDSLARQGYADAADAVANAWQAGDRDAALEALPDTLLDAVTAVGSPDDARERVRRFETLDGVDSVSVSLPRGATPAEIDATVEALAPS
ncbi:TIGR04024 family LLM class F420-dependent oxidoreductase [Natronobiforma cellulositropha]|uniref:TIGR04024 family LLM class F420-dependent oxidoreductase n=1 Tax=Natronobiforma cellulositropha TaxID=1679076 RepID=UPI0021D5B3F7|nr:TIGR04024 family LLM class F420-dependent oxidoreductase [Natronobiforma cellulositropha]